MQTEESGEEGPFLKNSNGFAFVAPPLVGGYKLETHLISLSVTAALKVAGVLESVQDVLGQKLCCNFKLKSIHPSINFSIPAYS